MVGEEGMLGTRGSRIGIGGLRTWSSVNYRVFVTNSGT